MAIHIRNFSLINKIFDEYPYFIESYDHLIIDAENITNSQREAIAKAILGVKDKIIERAKKENLKLGRIVNIDDKTNNLLCTHCNYIARSDIQEIQSSGGNATDLIPRELNIAAEATVTYEVK